MDMRLYGQERSKTRLNSLKLTCNSVVFGVYAYGRLLVAVYTWRGEKIRLISAQKATKQEQKHYGANYEKRI